MLLPRQHLPPMSDPTRARNDASNAPLDAVVLAWYRHRIASGHYDGLLMEDRVLDRLVTLPELASAGERADPREPRSR
jgi:hypothetical protein